MTRADIIQRFRDENPELDANVISDVTLNSWLIIGDSEICAKARLIVDSATVISVPGQGQYDMTLLNNFFDIDENPGGGVTRYNTSGNYKRLTKTTKASLDFNNSQWRTASQGTPLYYYRRGKYINLYPIPDTTITQFTIDFVCISQPFNNDNITPYNQLPYLSPFHPGLVLYLQWRAKVKIGKSDEALAAQQLYMQYVQWMITSVGGGKFGSIEFRPQGLPSAGRQR